MEQMGSTFGSKRAQSQMNFNKTTSHFKTKSGYHKTVTSDFGKEIKPFFRPPNQKKSLSSSILQGLQLNNHKKTFTKLSAIKKDSLPKTFQSDKNAIDIYKFEKGEFENQNFKPKFKVEKYNKTDKMVSELPAKKDDFQKQSQHIYKFQLSPDKWEQFKKPPKANLMDKQNEDKLIKIHDNQNKKANQKLLQTQDSLPKQTFFENNQQENRELIVKQLNDENAQYFMQDSVTNYSNTYENFRKYNSQTPNLNQGREYSPDQNTNQYRQLMQSTYNFFKNEENENFVYDEGQIPKFNSKDIALKVSKCLILANHNSPLALNIKPQSTMGKPNNFYLTINKFKDQEWYEKQMIKDKYNTLHKSLKHKRVNPKDKAIPPPGQKLQQQFSAEFQKIPFVYKNIPLEQQKYLPPSYDFFDQQKVQIGDGTWYHGKPPAGPEQFDEENFQAKKLSHRNITNQNQDNYLSKGFQVYQKIQKEMQDINKHNFQMEQPQFQGNLDQTPQNNANINMQDYGLGFKNWWLKKRHNIKRFNNMKAKMRSEVHVQQKVSPETYHQYEVLDYNKTWYKLLEKQGKFGNFNQDSISDSQQQSII